MNYKQAQVEFGSRLKTRDYKALYNSWLHMFKEEDGSFIFRRPTHLWDFVQTKTRHGMYRRTTTGHTDFARLTPDNVLTLICSPRSSDNQAKNLWIKLVGFGNAYSCVGKYRSYEHPLRFDKGGYDSNYKWRSEVNVPFVEGLAVNVSTRTVVSSTPDVRYRKNRARSKPVYEYVSKAMDVAHVLYRVGAIEPHKWNEPQVLFKSIATEQTALTEENLALLAEAAYNEARNYGSQVSYGFYDSERHIYKPHPKETVDRLRHERTLVGAAKHLRAFLQKKHGCLDAHIVS